MKHFLLLLTATTCFLSTVAQVRIPFDVSLPRWKALVTPTMEGQLFRTSDMQSDILIALPDQSMMNMNGADSLPNLLMKAKPAWLSLPELFCL